MTTIGGARELAEVLAAIGTVGAVLAAICAVVAAVAIIRGAGGLSGGAVGLWIVCALISFTASFANQWMPLLISCAALIAMLVIGGVVRAMVGATESGREPRRRKVADPAEARVRKPAPAPASVSTSTVAVVR